MFYNLLRVKDRQIKPPTQQARCIDLLQEVQRALPLSPRLNGFTSKLWNENKTTATKSICFGLGMRKIPVKERETETVDAISTKTLHNRDNNECAGRALGRSLLDNKLIQACCVWGHSWLSSEKVKWTICTCFGPSCKKFWFIIYLPLILDNKTDSWCTSLLKKKCTTPPSITPPVMSADRCPSCKPSIGSFHVNYCRIGQCLTPSFSFMRCLTSVRFIAMVQVLIFCDVLMRDQEQNHLALLVLYGHDVQQTPELGACSKNGDLINISDYEHCVTYSQVSCSCCYLPPFLYRMISVLNSRRSSRAFCICAVRRSLVSPPYRKWHMQLFCMSSPRAKPVSSQKPSEQ